MKLVEDNGVGFLETEFDSLKTKYQIQNAFTLNGLGYTYLFQDQLDEALTIFKVNLKLFPDVANCYDSLAECYLTREENDMAIKYYKMAFQKLDNDTTITDDFRERLKLSIPEQLETLGAQIDVQT